MLTTTKIAAQPRERAGKGAARTSRREGHVPGVIYGEKAPPQLIQLDPKMLDGEIHKPGFFTRIFDIDIAGKVQRALARDVQFHPITDRPEHIDFMRVGESTRIRVGIPVKFEHQDKSPGLKRGGVLNVVRHTVEVYCRVDNIPQAITVNLDDLDIGDSIHINDIKLPDGVKPTIARNFTIAAVAAPSVLKTAEEEAAEAAAAAAVAATAEGAVPAEGAAGAPGATPAAGAAAGAPAAGAKPGAPAAGAKPGAPAAAGAKPGAAPAAAAAKPAAKK